ncbi:hypothetical protein ACWEBX_32690 [Streptomyces sp. NPDC005070]
MNPTHQPVITPQAGVQVSVPTTHVYMNTQQEVIIVTKDKASLCLHDALGNMRKKDAWVAPFGVLVSIGFSLLTSDFKKVLGVSADAWKAVFIISGVISLFFLIKALWGMRKSVSVEDVVRRLSESPATVSTTSTPGSGPGSAAP